MKKLLTLFVLICPLLALAQQTRQITGQVLDRADGTPLVGATVFIAPEETQAKNYNPQGTIVYEQGRFAFKLPVSVKKVVVSYLGYEAQTIDISGKSNFTIYLSATESKMDAVVVTGYQRIEKRKLTSSIANVKMADIARDGVASVDEMLSGSIAGLTSTPTTGAPGGASKVKIRSTVTLNGNTDPLWVLDGMPLEGNDIPSDWSSKENVDNLYNMSIAGLNPADIEDITVLKDAAATAIYGARAANGVIIITTKKGRRNQATRVNVSASLFVTDRPNLDKLNLMNASQKVDLELALAANGRLNYLPGMGGVARILDQAGERAALVGRRIRIALPRNAVGDQRPAQKRHRLGQGDLPGGAQPAVQHQHLGRRQQGQLLFLGRLLQRTGNDRRHGIRASEPHAENRLRPAEKPALRHLGVRGAE